MFLSFEVLVLSVILAICVTLQVFAHDPGGAMTILCCQALSVY